MDAASRLAELSIAAPIYAGVSRAVVRESCAARRAGGFAYERMTARGIRRSTTQCIELVTNDKDIGLQCRP
jgi:hypothetical protein